MIDIFENINTVSYCDYWLHDYLFNIMCSRRSVVCRTLSTPRKIDFSLSFFTRHWCNKILVALEGLSLRQWGYRSCCPDLPSSSRARNVQQETQAVTWRTFFSLWKDEITSSPHSHISHPKSIFSHPLAHLIRLLSKNISVKLKFIL